MASQLSLEKKINVVTVLEEILDIKEVAHEIAFLLENLHEIEIFTKIACFDHFQHSLREYLQRFVFSSTWV